MSTDRELLEMAAKAARTAGLDVEFDAESGKVFDELSNEWNPLTDDGDALRLSVKLKMDILQYGDDDHSTKHACANYCIVEPYGKDPMAATRRAITRAAAEIGRAMP